MPAGIHRIVRDGAAQTIQIAGTTATLSSHEDRAHLLCSACELRFERHGEDWMLDNCWRSPADFPLLDLLERTATPHAKGDTRAYLGRTIPGVDVDRIVYFAASMFWRGGVHTWSAPKSKTNNAPPNRLRLGPYLEPLRVFLVGEAPFPEHMYLSTWVELKRDEDANRYAVPPFMAFDTGYHIFRFFIPGMVFTLWVGKTVSGEIQRTCTSRSGLLVLRPIDDLRDKEVRARVAESKRKGKLARLPKTP